MYVTMQPQTPRWRCFPIWPFVDRSTLYLADLQRRRIVCPRSDANSTTYSNDVRATRVGLHYDVVATTATRRFLFYQGIAF